MNREQIAARLNMDEMAPWRVRVLDEVEAIVREAVEAECAHRIQLEITPEDAPEHIADLGEEPMNAYADGWNDCVRLAKRMIRARGEKTV